MSKDIAVAPQGHLSEVFSDCCELEIRSLHHCQYRNSKIPSENSWIRIQIRITTKI